MSTGGVADRTWTAPRSYLYVPGNAPEKLDRALDRGADALILDLEDAVPDPGKDAARSRVISWLDGVNPQPRQVWVRVNSGAARDADVAALAGAEHLTGIVLAKAEDPGEVAAVAALLDAAGDTRTALMPLLETARAVINAASIAQQPRVSHLQLGEVDLCADTGIDPGPDEGELGPLRAHVVLASAAAGLPLPVGPVSRNLSDLASFEDSTRRLRRQGFFGRCCIHPAQLDIVHYVFTPTEQEVADATRTVAAFDAAVAAGRGVLLDDAGHLVDLAVVRSARRTVEVAEAARQQPR